MEEFEEARYSIDDLPSSEEGLNGFLTVEDVGSVEFVVVDLAHGKALGRSVPTTDEARAESKRWNAISEDKGTATPSDHEAMRLFANTLKEENMAAVAMMIAEAWDQAADAFQEQLAAIPQSKAELRAAAHEKKAARMAKRLAQKAEYEQMEVQENSEP